MKIVTILGARPQFVKASAVSRALAQQSSVEEIIIHTGQHFDANMSDVFFTELELKSPDHHLGIHGLGHGAMTGRMMELLEKHLLDLKPDVVLVYGDTDSTLAGALSAVKLHMPVAHVEAGLRSFNRSMPEEINRIVTDHVSELLFVPTETAVKNLHKEGIAGEKIFSVGDVMYDTTLYYSSLAKEKSNILSALDLQPQNYYLATIHRPNNTDEPKALELICNVLDEVAKSIPVVLPLHPRTRKKMNEFGLQVSHVKCIDPVGFLDMIQLESQASLIITDSGGVQKEAYFHQVPCVTLRPETEWIELVQHGWNIVVPPDSSVDMVAMIHDQASKKGDNVQLYGAGNASKLIAGHLVDKFGG